MNLHELIQHQGRVIFTTDVIYSYMNFDRRSNYSERNKQFELDFFGNKENVKNIRHSSTMSISDFRLLNSTIAALDKIYKHITLSLMAEFSDLYFEIMINDEDTHIIENYLHMLACNRDGIPLDKYTIEKVQEYLNDVFSEINELIYTINKTTYIKDISSVKLVNQPAEEADHIVFKNKGASGFVHALFNTDIKNIDVALSVYINNCLTKFHKPVIQDEKILLDKPHVVYVTLEVESKTSKKLHAKGFYLNGHTVTNEPFDEMIICKATGDLKEEYEALFNKIDSELYGQKVIATIKPLQPYVCHMDIDTKVKHLVSIEIAHLS